MTFSTCDKDDVDKSIMDSVNSFILVSFDLVTTYNFFVLVLLVD